MKRIVIIGCGSQKLSNPAPAHQLYTGSYFRGNLRWALSVVNLSQIFILSAKHGLIAASNPIAPYDLRMGAPSSVGVSLIRRQAEFHGLIGCEIVALCGQDYLSKLVQVFPNLKAPCRGLGIGKSLAAMKRNKGVWP